MKKIIVLFILSIPVYSHALQMDYLNPTYLDISGVSTNSTCVNSDPIGVDEADSTASINTTANHFCRALDFDGASVFSLDSSNNDPDICETNSGINTSIDNIAWRFDTSSTDIFDSITCFVSDSKVGCTYPNALNYDPNAQYNDGSCFYNSSGSGSTGTGNTDVTVNIGGSEGINKPIFDMITVQTIFNMQALLMFFLVFFRFFSRIISTSGKNDNFVNKI